MVSPSGMPKNAPAPNAAQLFIEFLLTRRPPRSGQKHFNVSMIKGIKPAPGAKPLEDVKTIRPTRGRDHQGHPGSDGAVPRHVRRVRLDGHIAARRAASRPGRGDALAPRRADRSFARRWRRPRASRAMASWLVADRGAAVPGRQSAGAAADRQLPGARDRRASRSPTTPRPTAASRYLRGAVEFARARRRRAALLCLSSACRSPGRSRAPTCPARASSGCRSSAPSSSRPISARSAGSCWPARMPAGSTALDRAHRRRQGPVQRLLDAGAGPGHRAATSFPYVFVFTKSALDLVSSEMEDAANILGAGNLRTTLRDHAAAGAAGDPRRVHHRRSSKRSRCSARRR